MQKTILIIGLAISMQFDACLRPPEDKYVKISGYTQGTTYHITYERKYGLNMQKTVDSLLTLFDNSLSTYKTTSLISRFNQNDTGIYVDELLQRVYLVARKVHKETNGAFDITVAPVVNAWGFGFGEKTDIDSALIDSLLAYVGMENITLGEDSFLRKTYPQLMIDVNAIAQGYSTDYIAAYFDGLGMPSYLVEIGGEIKTKGFKQKNKPWKIGIDKPIDNNMIPGKNLQTLLELTNKCLATSGNYRKFYEKNGIKYAHSIDPKTGYPVISRLLSATVVANEGIYADAWATACMVLGLEKSIALLQEHPELQAILIYSDDKGDYQSYISDSLKEKVEEIAN